MVATATLQKPLCAEVPASVGLSVESAVGGDDKAKMVPSFDVARQGRSEQTVAADSSTGEVAASGVRGAEWYVMRVTYQRELVAQRLLDELGVKSFVPTMKVRRRKAGGKFYWREEAKMHNYIFVLSTLAELQQIKTTKIPYLRYMMAKGDSGTPTPQFVPVQQMEDFMAVCRSEGVKYLDPEIDLRKGDKVKILCGPLAGVEGIYTKTSLKNEKRVVVRIEGVAAVATIALPASEVEKI